ncbi:hypothetical protein HK405_011591 [Cladochytrium tenue]|nr:hypothetical protein HK405_011591 [Cladochytrium tenue]
MTILFSQTFAADGTSSSEPTAAVAAAASSPSGVLLGIHCIAGHSGRWRDLAVRIARPIVAFDLRGHGRSTWDCPWSLAQHVRDVLETVDALGIAEGGRKIHILGHSFGGLLTCAVWAARPDMVKSLILADPVVRVVAPRSQLPMTLLFGFDPSKATLFASGFLDPLPYAYPDIQTAALSRSASISEPSLRAAGCLDPDSGAIVRPHPALDVDLGPDHLLSDAPDPLLLPDPAARPVRFRWSRPAILVAASELATPLPRPPVAAATDAADAPHRPDRVLLMPARLAPFVGDAQLDAARDAFGADRTEVRWLECGHMVMWELPQEFADLVKKHLATFD